MTATLILGSIRDYDVLIGSDAIHVRSTGGLRLAHPVPNYGTGIGELMSRPGSALGWAELPDFEVIYFYSKEDGFGYALNVTDPGLSEWGYSPFAPEGEDS